VPTVTDAGFLTVCLNPVLQRTLSFPALRIGGVNRTEEHRVDASGKGINVARVLTQLGARATALTTVGGRFADYFLDLTRRDELTVEQWNPAPISAGAPRWWTAGRAPPPSSSSRAARVGERRGRRRAAFERLLPHHHR
jgi:hypothetical protein